MQEKDPHHQDDQADVSPLIRPGFCYFDADAAGWITVYLQSQWHLSTAAFLITCSRYAEVVTN